MKRFFRILFLFLFVALITRSTWAASYKIDPEHSSVSFKIRHLLSHVTGNFNTFEGTIEYDAAAPEKSSAQATIQAASIDTNVEGRDKHLKTADFFDVEKYPTLTFKSTSVSDVKENHGKLNGILNMHGVEKPITLDLEMHGVGKDPWGNTRAGFSATTKINRKDFGIVWNKALESGQVLLGEDVEVTLDVEGVLKS